MIIGVTDTMGSEHKFQKYIDWLRRGGTSVEWKRLSYRLDNLVEVDGCDGILLTGGHDVDPSFYGRTSNHPKITDVDLKRDEFELKVIERTLASRIPLLGICRGLQIANVYFGGTLIPDLEDAGYRPHKTDGSSECRHDVSVEDGSMLHCISGVETGNVNSSHHQAVDSLGNGLKAVTRSDDGIIEGMEMNAEYPFFLLVQWHPERMNDFDNPLSRQLLVRFLESADPERMEQKSNRKETQRTL